MSLRSLLMTLLVIFALASSANAAEFNPLRPGQAVVIRPDRSYLLIRCQAQGKCVPPLLLRLPKVAGSESQVRQPPASETKVVNMFVPDASDYFEKDGDLTTFLVDAAPGTYVVYGLGIKYAFFSCFCLGTVKAEARPGTITDFGTSVAGRAADPSPYPALASMTGLGKSFEMDFPLLVGALTPARSTTQRPATLAGMPLALAEFHAVAPYYDANARSPTHLPPISGVLDYRRGRVIDVRTGEELPDLIP